MKKWYAEKPETFIKIPCNRPGPDTYQYGKEEPRYSRRVSLEEIERNDFNLNISRYVSTAKAKEEIDRAAAHAQLLAIDQKIKEATERHNAFLAELGLPPLPGGK